MTLRPTVLCIEDDDDLWKMLSRRLRADYLPIRAASDVEACVLLRALGSELAAVVTDLNLQGSELSGIELIRLVRGTLPAGQMPAWARGVLVRPVLPIVVTTGSDVHLIHARLAGASNVLLKPFHFSTLQGVLAQHTGLQAPGVGCLQRLPFQMGSQR